MKLTPDQIAERKISDAALIAKDLISTAANTAAGIIKDVKRESTETLAVLANDISYIKRDVSDIKQKLEDHYVTKDEFTPVRNIVYGLVGILGVATIGAILKLVLKV